MNESFVMLNDERLSKPKSSDLDLESERLGVFEDMEAGLICDLEKDFADLQGLEEDRKKIGNPETLGETVLNVVWEQVVNQIGVVAGEDFIKANRGLTLDLSKDAHIQTTENFADGKIASHNDKIDYQKRYDEWQSNFVKDEQGNVVTHKTRTGREEATLVKGARDPFDKDRPAGSKDDHTAMDHTVPAAELIRDPGVNAHMTKDEQIDFANSDKNLNEIDSSLNSSKGDLPTNEWLDNPNANGQKPDEIFDNLGEEEKRKLRDKDAEAREELEKRKKEAEQRSIEAGKKSRKDEAFRIGGKALRAAIMGLLAELIKNMVHKFIGWLKSHSKSLATLIEHMKSAIKTFFANLKENLLTAGNTFLTSILTAVFGPIVSIIKKAWIFLKQGAKSLKDAIVYIKDPLNRNKPVSILLIEIGKIVMSGIAAAGAIALSEIIEKGLLLIPMFAIEIPLFGSLASIIGLFLGALVSGLIGALALNLMDRAITGILKRDNLRKQIKQKNDILGKQDALIAVKVKKTVQVKSVAGQLISQRHAAAASEISQSLQTIFNETGVVYPDVADTLDKSNSALEEILK